MKNILIIEDDRVNATLVTRYLEANGYQCKCCNSAKEAIEYSAGSPIDLVLTDYMLAGEMNGIDAFKEIKKNNIT
ncbi:MAG: response regulator [Planctomycetes bacterium]|nr:response regulator [Planctomycetota bacterium]